MIDYIFRQISKCFLTTPTFNRQSGDQGIIVALLHYAIVKKIHLTFYIKYRLPQVCIRSAQGIRAVHTKPDTPYNPFVTGFKNPLRNRLKRLLALRFTRFHGINRWVLATVCNIGVVKTVFPSQFKIKRREGF